MYLNHNLPGYHCRSFFGDDNPIRHFSGCHSRTDITLLRRSTFPTAEAGDFGATYFADVPQYEENNCNSCGAHGLYYRPDGEYGRPLNVPAAFTMRENVKSHEELGSVADDIYECVKSAFNRQDFDKQDTLHHLSGDIFITAHQGEKLVAFSSAVVGSPREVLSNTSLPEQTGLYLAAGVVAQESQSQGIYQAMLLYRLFAGLDKGLSLVYTRTQNPRIEQSIHSALKILDNGNHIPGYTVDRVKLPGFYGGMLTNETPSSTSQHLQKIYAELDMQAGDAYVLLFNLQKGKK
jgi:hypothetical protein